MDELLMRRRNMFQTKIEPGEDGYCWIYYNITTTSSDTTLMYDRRNTIGNIVYIDGNPVSLGTSTNALKYRFSTTGIHLMKYQENYGYSRFNGVATIVEAYMTGNMGTQSNYFYNSSNLQKIVLPATMTSLDISMFNGCKSLSVLNTRNVQTITGSLRDGTNGITTLEFPNVITISAILDNGRNTSVKTIDLGPYVTTINGTWVYHSGVTTIISRATTPPSAGGAVYGLQTDYKVYVPYSSDHSILNTYKATSGWSSASSRMYELTENGQIPTT